MKRILFSLLLLAPFFAGAQNPNFNYIKQTTYTATGTDTYAVSSIAGVASYVPGLELKVKFTNANTGTASLNVNSIGAVTLKKNGGTNLAASDLAAGATYRLTYDGTNFQVLGINTGDQTSIVGITGTTAQFNTALTDNDFATLAGSETLTNKTFALGNNTLTGTSNQAVSIVTDPARTVTGTGAIVQADNGRTIYFNSATPFNFTIDALTINSFATFRNIGSATVTFVDGSGVTSSGGTSIAAGSTGAIEYQTGTTPIIDIGGGGGGITNSAANTELMMSNGTNAVPSGIFVGGYNLVLGNSSLTGDRYIAAVNSTSNANLTLVAEGAINLSFASQSSKFFGTTVSGNNVHALAFGNNGSGPSVGGLITINNDGTGTSNGAGLYFVAGSPASGNNNGGDLYFKGGESTGTGTDGNLAFHAITGSFGSGAKVAFFADASANPTGAISNGGVLFVKASDHLPYWRTGTTEYPLLGAGSYITNGSDTFTVGSGQVTLAIPTFGTVYEQGRGYVRLLDTAVGSYFSGPNGNGSSGVTFFQAGNINSGVGTAKSADAYFTGGNGLVSNFSGGDAILWGGSASGSGVIGNVRIAEAAGKITFFEGTPVVKQSAVTTAQGIADALTAYGLIPSSTVSGGGGSGDVVGPSSSTTNTLAVFADATGKLLTQASNPSSTRLGSAGVDLTFYKEAPVTGYNIIKAASGGSGEDHALDIHIVGGNATGNNYKGGDAFLYGGTPHGSGSVGAAKIAKSTDKLSFFEVTPVVKQSAVTTPQGIADVLTAYGLLPSSTVSGGSGLTYSQTKAISMKIR